VLSRLRALALAGVGLFLTESVPAWTEFPEGQVQVEDLRAKGTFDGLLRFRLKPGWHIYWLHPGDAGYAPSLRIGQDTARLRFPLPKRLDLGGDVIALTHSDSVAFPFHAAAWKGADTLTVKFLVCKESCLPRKFPLVAVPGDTANLGTLLSHLPDAGHSAVVLHRSGTAHQGELWAGFPGKASESSAHLYAAPPVDWRAGRELAARTTGDTLWLGLAITPYGDSLPGSGKVLLAAGPWRDGTAWQDSVELTVGSAPAMPVTAGQGSLWLALLMGLAGGLLLNLMPCVLPVLALKALSLTRLSSEAKRTARLSGLASAAGILTGLASLATVVVLLKATGIATGWGAQFQEPRYVAFLAGLMVLFAVNLLGLFEFRVPGVVLTGTRTHLVGEYLQGLLAVALSTPCSAPILGSAIGIAIGQPIAGIYAIFLSIGTGLALPYLLLALFPGLARFLPRPGAWMETLRRVLSIPMFATALWLLWVLGGQIDRGLHLQIQFLLLGMAGLAALVGWAQGSQRRRVERLAFLATVAVLMAAATAARAEVVSGKVRWMAFSQARLDSLGAAGKPVLVDGTADWCLTCKLNKARVLRDGAVEDAFAQAGLVVLEADWTRRDSAFGAWMAGYGRQAVPFNLLVRPGKEPRLLPELLTKGAVLGALEGQ
jgi:DsbC/DsbD-like thiol-disulfide interchange protein/cytochrome c biogenesis protein CcdA